MIATTNKDKFCADELTITVPQCDTCKHYDGNLSCAAYPKGIPCMILTNELMHDASVMGDHGLQYEKMA